MATVSRAEVTYQLTLSTPEAEALAAILGHVGGGGPSRSLITDIASELESAGVEFDGDRITFADYNAPDNYTVISDTEDLMIVFTDSGGLRDE